MSTPAWKLRLQMQGKDVAKCEANPTENSSTQHTGQPACDHQANKKDNAATTATPTQPTTATKAPSQNDADTAAAQFNNSEGYSGPKEQEKPQFAYRAPEENIKKSFEPKKWENNAFQGVSPMDFFVRQNNAKKKVRESERQEAARVYKHNTYDKSMFE